VGVVFKIEGDIGVGWDSEHLPDAGAIFARPQVSLWSFSLLALAECHFPYNCICTFFFMFVQDA